MLLDLSDTQERGRMTDHNTAIIEEFRANAGKVGGYFEGWTLLLMHHAGAKSGEQRITPLAYQPIDRGWAIFASRGGAAHNPSWYHNLLANPDVVVEVGTDTIEVAARVANGEERERIWTKQKADYPNFAAYERKTDRTIPVLVLEPR